METQEKKTPEEKRKTRIEQLEEKLAKAKKLERQAAKREEAKKFLPLGKFVAAQIKKGDFNVNFKTEEGVNNAAFVLLEIGSIVFSLLRSLPQAEAQHLLQQIAAKKPAASTLNRLQLAVARQQ